MGWNAERVELLKKLWADGLTASAIAAQLAGITRNAVIGKVHRLGLSGRKRTPSQRPARVRKERAVKPYVPRPALQNAGDLEHATASEAPSVMRLFGSLRGRKSAADRFHSFRSKECQSIECAGKPAYGSPYCIPCYRMMYQRNSWVLEAVADFVADPPLVPASPAVPAQSPQPEFLVA